jgi:hypothetical protein
MGRTVTDPALADLWWKNGLVYCIDVKVWRDSDGDGIGDLAGLSGSIDYLASLGVTCIWLMPVCPSPWRDDGYDVTDYYRVDPRLGTLGDFVSFVHAAHAAGIRVLLDLPLNHTSNEHPWFQQARRSRQSPYRSFYKWYAQCPEELPPPVFPGEQETTCTYDAMAGEYYLHRYYDFMPDLDTADPRVRQEIYKIMGFWLAMGVDGFRLDSVPMLVEELPDRDDEQAAHGFLSDLRSFVSRRRGDAALVGEANLPVEELGPFFGSSGDEATTTNCPSSTCWGPMRRTPSSRRTRPTPSSALMNAVSGAGSLRCSAATATESGWPFRCCCPCPACRCCCMATRSGWARIWPRTDGSPYAHRCNGTAAATAVSRPPPIRYDGHGRAGVSAIAW